MLRKCNKKLWNEKIKITEEMVKARFNAGNCTSCGELINDCYYFDSGKRHCQTCARKNPIPVHWQLVTWYTPVNAKEIIRKEMEL